jgi:hypothetical protein
MVTCSISPLYAELERWSHTVADSVAAYTCIFCSLNWAFYRRLTRGTEKEGEKEDEKEDEGPQ